MREPDKQKKYNRTEIKQLVQEAIAGNKESFSLLMRMHYKQIYYRVYGYLHHPDDTEDLVQDVFVRLYQYLGKLQNPQKFTGWLNQVIRNICLDHIQDCRKETDAMAQYIGVVQHESKQTQLEADLNARLELKNKWLEIQKYIGLLPDIYREVMTLYFCDQYSAKEIAGKLHISKNAVEVRIYRAKQIIRKSRKGKTT
jgi:RNA polymerase sigma factor (sigma-70 family)